VLGALPHAAAELFHRGGRLLQRTGLLLGALGQVLVAGGDLALTALPALLGQALRHGALPADEPRRDGRKPLGWDSCDIVIVSGDAYVDHPSFGMAVIGRTLEAQGFPRGHHRAARLAVGGRPSRRSAGRTCSSAWRPGTWTR
jgi:hypothetical protein